MNVVVFPVGGQDIGQTDHSDSRLAGASCGADHGGLPCSDEFSTAHGDQFKAEVRRWGAACLEAISGFNPSEQVDLVTRHLEAPILRRVLDGLDSPVERLVLVSSDQDQDLPFARDDTCEFARLLALWVQGLDQPLTVAEVTITQSPHLVDEVAGQFAEAVDRVMAGASDAVLVQAGGTPGMPLGIMAVLLRREGLELTLLQVPRDPGVPLAASELPAMIKQSRVLGVAAGFLDRRDPAAALPVLMGAELGEQHPSVGLCELAMSIENRERPRKKYKAVKEHVEQSLQTSIEEHLRRLEQAQNIHLCLWDSVSAWGIGRYAEFLTLLIALNEALGREWFRINARTVGDLKALLPEMNWTSFASCALSSRNERNVQLRRNLGTSRDDQDIAPETSLLIMRCAGSSRPCTCGLRRAAPAELKKAAQAWNRIYESDLRGLRNSSVLAHGTGATHPKQVENALAAVVKSPTEDAPIDLTTERVKDFLTGHVRAFGIEPGDDLVAGVCAAARDSLAKPV